MENHSSEHDQTQQHQQPNVDYSQTQSTTYDQTGYQTQAPPPQQPGPTGQFTAEANFTYQTNNSGATKPAQFPPQSSQNPAQFPPRQYNNQPNPLPPYANGGGPQSQQPAPYQNGGYGQQQPGGYNNSGPPPAKFPPSNGGAMPMPMPGQQGYNNGSIPGYPVNNPISPIMIQQPMNLEGWRTGLFDCFDDPMNALVTFFFPCITFGQVAEILDNGQSTCATSGMLYGLVWFLLGIPCAVSCSYRTKLRSKFGLLESPAPDCITHFLCETCALCQEYRELQHRGLDPAIGWQGNVAKVQAGFLQQQGQANMNPPMNQRMMS